MLGRSALTTASGSAANNRLFVYEVEGLRQNLQSDQVNPAIRSSSTVSLTVAYNRMNEEMRRLTRLGCKIVSIRPLNGDAEQA